MIYFQLWVVGISRPSSVYPFKNIHWRYFKIYLNMVRVFDIFAFGFLFQLPEIKTSTLFQAATITIHMFHDLKDWALFNNALSPYFLVGKIVLFLSFYWTLANCLFLASLSYLPKSLSLPRFLSWISSNIFSLVISLSVSMRRLLSYF